MTSNKSLLHDKAKINNCNARRVHLPNGTTTTVSHVGSYTMGNTGTLSNVLCIPNFKYNLLSVSKITRDLCCSATFSPHFFLFQDLYSGKVKVIGRERE